MTKLTMDEPPKSKQQKTITNEEEAQILNNGGASIDRISEDILQIILSKLPAVSFSYAACVSRTWYRVCNRLLLKPKFASALSTNKRTKDAVTEVLDKVLSEPIRPHFAIACIGVNFSLDLAHELITKRLGSKTPVITSVAEGIMGADALTNEFKEVKWTTEFDHEEHNLPHNIHCGITLMIGFVPDLKVEAVPLVRSIEDCHDSTVDKFVIDIRDYTASVSGGTSPEAIVMFGDKHTDMRPVLAKMDYAMSRETAIVGDECGSFLYNNADPSRYPNLNRTGEHYCGGIALVFVRDKTKLEVLGETQFHVMLSAGLSPVGSLYKAVSVKVRGKQTESNTWLTARQEGLREILDGNRIIEDIYEEMENQNESMAEVLYTGITKRRKCAIGSEKPRVVTSLVYHAVVGGDAEYLYVESSGIRTGDVFHFYRPDSGVASSSCCTISEKLGRLQNGGKNEVCGGIVVACCGRGDSFFGRPNVDSSPFFENFPRIPMIGLFCNGEIGRGSSRFVGHEDQEPSSLNCYLHAYSTVYLVLSYTPPFSRA